MDLQLKFELSIDSWSLDICEHLYMHEKLSHTLFLALAQVSSKGQRLRVFVPLDLLLDFQPRDAMELFFLFLWCKCGACEALIKNNTNILLSIGELREGLWSFNPCGREAYTLTSLESSVAYLSEVIFEWCLGTLPIFLSCSSGHTLL